MLRILAIPALAVLVTACAVPPAPPAPEEVSGVVVSPGLRVEPYEGVFADYPPMRETLAALPAVIEASRDSLARRLGVALDPDRPRILRVDDSLETSRVETRLTGDRMVQFIRLPAGPLAQRRLAPGVAVSDALCAAALADPGNETLPAWFRAGAPLWVSGRWERVLMERVLGGPSVILDADRVAPPLDLESAEPDPLSSAFAFRYLASEFGADRMPALTRSLAAADSPGEGLRAALDVAADALPVALDGYRLMTVSDVVEDPFVRELAAVRDRGPAERIQRLTGLASRAESRYIGAAILELLGLSEFEAGQFAAAADTLAAIERGYAAHALHPARNNLYFALSFARRGEDEAAALRLSTFLDEFPASEYAPLALFELGSILLRVGRTSDAMARFEDLVERFPGDSSAGNSRIVLAAYQRARHRYGLAAEHLRRALPDPEAARQLAELEPHLHAPLPEAAAPLVDGAIRDLSAEPSQSAAVRTLIHVGPAAGARLWTVAGESEDVGLMLGIVRVFAGWPEDESRLWLARMLTIDDESVAGAVFEALLSQGLAPPQIGSMLELHPFDTPAADRVFAEKYGRRPEVTALSRSEDFRDRVEAARRLGGDADPGAFTALAGLTVDASPQVRRAAVASMGLRNEPEAARLLLNALEDQSALVRLEALSALVGRGDLSPVRDIVLADPDARVRLQAARALLRDGSAEDLGRVIRLLGDSDAGVGSGVEAMLRDFSEESLGPALSEALKAVERPGLAMRIVRVMGHHIDRDLGYDPGGGPEERTRVALEFLRLWAEGR